MRLSIQTIWALAALATAQSNRTVTSAPFKLVLRSSNATLDGAVLNSGHAGSMLQWLGPTRDESDKRYITYNMLNESPRNLTNGFDPANTDEFGIIRWILPLSTGDVGMFWKHTSEWPSSSTHQPDPSMQVVTLTPNDEGATYPIGFNKTGAMFRYEGYIPNRDQGNAHTIFEFSYNWFICDDAQLFVPERGLTWFPHGTIPQPGRPCQKVDIFRQLP